jgi:hypothetical protein
VQEIALVCALHTELFKRKCKRWFEVKNNEKKILSHSLYIKILDANEDCFKLCLELGKELLDIRFFFEVNMREVLLEEKIYPFLQDPVDLLRDNPHKVLLFLLEYGYRILHNVEQLTKDSVILTTDYNLVLVLAHGLKE